MSEIALAVGDRITSEYELAKPVREKINQARADRKPLEAVWQSNLAFAAGKFHLKWDRDQRRLVFPPELYGKELFSEDVTTEFRTTALGELGSDDDRPELLLRRDDEASEDYQDQINKAVAYGWDHEWKGDTVLEEVRRLCIDMGTAAVQCAFDPTQGPQLPGDLPHLNGKPVLDIGQATDLFENGPNPQVKMRQMRQGRITWRALSAMNLLVPSGIPHEMNFPWECVIRPVLLADVKAHYGDPAKDLKEDTDIGSLLGMDANSEQADSRGWGGGPKTTRVRDHVWLFTYFERPSAEWPKGRTVTLGSNQLKLLDHTGELPYVGPDGEYRSGIAYFHWWRVTGRFWSRALVESIKDIQRAMNKLATQRAQIIDRGMPFVIVEEGSGLDKRKGLPVEVLHVKPQTSQPIINDGIPVGEWMYKERESKQDALEHATGLYGPGRGDNPANVNTYSQLAMLHEADQKKREQIYREHKDSVARLVEDSVYDMRTYWGPSKQLMLAGDDDRVDAAVFDATKIPSFFIVKPAKGTSKPRTQAAELTKIEQLWNAAVTAGVVATAPQEWIDWYKESLDAGQALELPHMQADDQTHKAHLENHLLMQGAQIMPDYFDPPDVHIPIHRSAQIQARLSGEEPVWQAVEQHVLAHEQAAAQAAAQASAAAQSAMPQQPQPPLGPGQPPAGPPAPPAQ